MLTLSRTVDECKPLVAGSGAGTGEVGASVEERTAAVVAAVETAAGPGACEVGHHCSGSPH